MNDFLIGVFFSQKFKYRFLQFSQLGYIYDVWYEEYHYILKVYPSRLSREREEKMLRDLSIHHISTANIYASKDIFLLLEYLEDSIVDTDSRDRKASKSILALHAVGNDAEMFGYYYDTPLGKILQKNEQTHRAWGIFLTYMRLLPVTKMCYDLKILSKKEKDSIALLCRYLYRYIDIKNITPSLLHGDIWSGNIRINQEGAFLIDPALYFGDKEMDLAYILLRDTFGKTFFTLYQEVYPLDKDFYRIRLPLYQLYPLLVHCLLGDLYYLPRIREILKQLKI